MFQHGHHVHGLFNKISFRSLSWSLSRSEKKILRTFSRLGLKILSRLWKGGEWNMWWAYKVSLCCEYKSNWGIWCENPQNIWNWRFRELWLEMWRKCELWSNQQIANQDGADFPSSWATLPGENIWEISDLNVVEFFGPIFHRAANFILLESLLGWLGGWLGGLCKDGTAGRPLKPAPQTISFGKSAN